MFILRSVIYFILLFIVFEAVALSAVVWSFYESVQNSLKQEAVLSDHRARDFVLALAKAVEPRLNQEGFSELNKTFGRYVEVTSQDPEKFILKEIRLFNVKGVLLSSSVEGEVAEPLEKRKPSVGLTEESYFRKAIRMRKWEWSHPEEDSKDLSTKHPELPEFAKGLVKFFPLANANEVRMYAPVYHTGKLEVLGAVIFKYERGNLLLLFENQLELAKWLLLNYSLIAVCLSILLWGIFFLFHYFAREEGGAASSSPVVVSEENPPLFEKKTITPPSEVSTLVDLTETDNEAGVPAQKALPDREISPPPAGVVDAIFLG
ncbi:LIC_12071 family protein [Leptospira idonii]|uniref:Uncharacterized protein n=1 Tax=Leptospira idonii TaxID=1193500 RepID=A0A4R9LUK3_9LEPT|nr:hypothetical protein [Leptospira idonii]TGN17596.1 hypothetical protein EHS15_16310 [Leptospira idonii]